MLASDVGVIRGGYQAHGLRRAGKHVAESVGDPLDLVGLEANLIVDDATGKNTKPYQACDIALSVSIQLTSPFSF